MSKSPFTVRIEDFSQKKFRAMATVLNQDYAVFYEEILALREANLNEKQRKAVDMLLSLWESDRK